MLQCASRGGGVCSGGVPGPRGGVMVSAPGGGAWSGGSALGGCLLRGGFSLPGDPPPVNRITHTCKNITLATTSLRPVITLSSCNSDGSTF